MHRRCRSRLRAWDDPRQPAAVEVARIVPEHAADPEVRTLAEAVVAAQEAGIQWMQEWQANSGAQDLHSQAKGQLGNSGPVGRFEQVRLRRLKRG